MLKGKAKTDYMKQYMREYRLKKQDVRPPEMGGVRWCEACGESRVVESHHIDKSHDNQSDENLIDLCPTCHKVLHKEGLTINELLYKLPASPGVRPTTTNDWYDAEDSTVYVPDIDADGNPVYDS